MGKILDEYRRERKRIQRYISYRKSLGFFSNFELPKIPKKVTRGSVRRLKKYTPEKLRGYEDIFVDVETGEAFHSKNHEKLTEEYNRVKKRKKSGKRDRGKDEEILAEMVIQNFIAESAYYPNSAYNVVRNYVDFIRGEIKANGEFTIIDFANAIEEAKKGGVYLTYEMAYDPAALSDYLVKVTQNIRGMAGSQFLIEAIETMVEENDWYVYEISGEY